MANKGISTNMALLVGFIFIGSVVGGSIYYVTTYSVAPTQGTQGNGEVVVNDDGSVTVEGSTCDPRASNTPDITYSVVNPGNTSSTEYKASTVKFYKGDYSLTNLPPASAHVGDKAASATGTTTVGSTFKLSCDTPYTLVIESSGTTSSAIGTVTMDEQAKTIELQSWDHAALIAKAKDNDADAFVYCDTEGTASNSCDTGSSFSNTTQNTTTGSVGKTLAAGGGLDYTLTFETNITAAGDTRFTDQTTYLVIDQGDNSDWPEPSVTGTYKSKGVDLTAIDCGDIDSKIANDGYDYCYIAEGVLLEKGADFVVNYVNDAKTDVNPSDDVIVGLVTSGLFKNTLNQGISEGTNKDDASDTYVFTAQSWTILVA